MSKIFVMLILSVFSFATTWTTIKVVDPISKDSVCVQEIMSWGTYIYHWPSKYDGIYWPITDPKFIRFNPKNGYIAFGSDFLEITDEEIERVKPFLQANYDPNSQPETFEEKLKWLLKVYEVRGVSLDFKIRYYRLLCHLSCEDKEKNNQFRRLTIELEKEYLAEREENFWLGESYYILGFYSKLLGEEEKSNMYFEKLKSLVWKNEKGEVDEDGKNHLLDLVKNVKSGDWKEEYFQK